MATARDSKSLPTRGDRNAVGPYGLHWFRRDLRVAGNPALDWNRRELRGRVLGIVCLDPALRTQPDFSPERFAFMLETLKALTAELRVEGGDLWVFDAPPEDAFLRVRTTLLAAGAPLPATVSFNRDYEPDGRARDAAVTALCELRLGARVHTERDHLILEPDELRKPDAARDAPTFYQVFTPFHRRWRDLMKTASLRERITSERAALVARGATQRSSARTFALTWRELVGPGEALTDALAQLLEAHRPRARVPLPAAGTDAALARLRAFTTRVDGYDRDRDRLAFDGTSRLSADFANGALVPAQALALLGVELDDRAGAAANSDGRAAFLRQIVWRELYHHILWHRPDVKGRSFLPAYRDLKWENREDWFAAWQAGRTGFPIVDAGMRQLAETGWMHNRARMIVASFLTKDLLIDWRWGERHFMQRLLDGDLAENNGGWQWAASTGNDPQPYFRVFNPVLQGRRFDPDGAYVRRFVPELRDVVGNAIHEPHNPIVDHQRQKEKAVTLYRRASR